jgi:hypothetical protein
MIAREEKRNCYNDWINSINFVFSLFVETAHPQEKQNLVHNDQNTGRQRLGSAGTISVSSEESTGLTTHRGKMSETT